MCLQPFLDAAFWMQQDMWGAGSRLAVAAELGVNQLPTLCRMGSVTGLVLRVRSIVPRTCCEMTLTGLDLQVPKGDFLWA